MSIDTKLITKLRGLTGAGISDCKQVLEEALGDMDKAVELLRKKGAVKAAKKSERETKEGVIAMTQDGNRVAIAALACETDFVARNQDFIQAVSDFAKQLLALGQDDFKVWVQAKIKDELIVKIGENIQLVESEIIEGEVLGAYLHSNKKVASVVVLSGGSQELAIDLAMQVAAMSPKYVKPEDISSEEIEKEKEIYREQLKSEGKPEAMWEKIMPGKLNKYYQEVCLLNQPFIKEDKLSVQDYIKKQGEGIAIVKFSRYQI
ncbi:MAG: translation elongation factor Ts [Patescibacteria group bacterium]|jgi:elongation factor Ts|nr:translation elongation factor Ts [Patescibacteria group bacterium]